MDRPEREKITKVEQEAEHILTASDVLEDKLESLPGLVSEALDPNILSAAAHYWSSQHKLAASGDVSAQENVASTVQNWSKLPPDSDAKKQISGILSFLDEINPAAAGDMRKSA